MRPEDRPFPLDPMRVQAVFGSAIACDSDEELAAVLERECSTDVELRRRIEALLRAHDRPDSLLDRPMLGLDGIVAIAEAEEDGLGSVWAMSSAGASHDSDPTIGLAPADISVIGHVGMGGNHAVVPTIEGYEILEELGRGGMGVVYKARQILLNRPCALKMILGGVHAGADASARFLAEAQAIARLRHPHIVQIHHIGEAEGLPFLDLEYVEGGGLDRTLDGTPWNSRRAAGLVEILAGAVAEAHRLGIVHRDLKPGNILLMGDGTPRITDFGLAKSLDTDTRLTATDSIMGSPSYMAPEQAAGLTREIGPPADIHALGAILYELLTGRPPFRGTSILETLDQVKAVEPLPPSRLVPGLHRDVETIALKCLQKEPGKRYDSAAALADDLRRFLGGEPILARPVPAWERAWRWCRRHPAPASLTVAVVLVTILGLAGVLWQWGEAVKARDLASKRASAEAEARRETETTLVDMYTTGGIAAGDQGEHARAALWFANAARRAEADPDRRIANLVRARAWGRRAFTPLRAFVADGSWPGGLEFHPGGRHLITRTIIEGTTRDSSYRLWDLNGERPLSFPDGSGEVPAAAWSPDGRTLATGGLDGDVVVARFPGGEPATHIPFPDRVRLLNYSPDGRFLAIAGGNSARVWDVRSSTFATPELIHPEPVTTLAFHPKGRYLASGCLDHTARLFAVKRDTKGPLWPPVPHRQEVGSSFFPTFSAPPSFVNRGKELITYGGREGLTWRSVETGATVKRLESPEVPDNIASVEPSPDGRFLAILGFQASSVRLVEAATGRTVGLPLEHRNTVRSVRFSPDGQTLLTGSSDNTARLWGLGGAGPLASLDLHRTVNLVAFAPDGRSMATQDGAVVRLWAFPGDGIPITRVPIGAYSFAAISPDGSLAIPTGVSIAWRGIRGTRAYRIATGLAAGPTLHPGVPIIDAAFSPDSRSVVTLGGRDDQSEGQLEVRAWDWASGRERWRAVPPSEPRSVAFRPDGRRLAVLCDGGEVLVFDPESGLETFRWRAYDTQADAQQWINNGKVAFSPDGRSVLTWGMGNDVRAWDDETGRPRYPPIGHRDKCHDLQFSPDGRSMALASYDGSVRVRDVATGKVLADLPAHPDAVYSAGFSPDGHLLVTACRDHSVRVWDWRAGRLVCPPFEHQKDAVAATFTRDGRRVLSASADHFVRAWDWRSGKPLTPPLLIGHPMSLSVTPDGEHAVVGGFGSTLALLDLRPLASDDGDPASLCLVAELLAVQRLHHGGGTVNLSAEEWLERWRAFRRQSPAADFPEHQLALDPISNEAEDSSEGEGSLEPVAIDELANRFNRADAALKAGRFDEAIETGRGLVPLLRRAVVQRPDDPGTRHRLSLALVLAGDREGYQRACAETLERFRGSESPLAGEAARTCLVAAGAVDDPSAPRRLAESALSREPASPWLNYVLGLADYRAGRSAGAVEHLEESTKLGGNWAATQLNMPVLAMAHHRLGHKDEARVWLEKAHGRGGSERSWEVLNSFGAWWDRLEFRLLIREADELILDRTFPASPFAR